MDGLRGVNTPRDEARERAEIDFGCAASSLLERLLSGPASDGERCPAINRFVNNQIMRKTMETRTESTS